MENIVLTIYYCKYKDPQRNIYQKTDNFAYISAFYNSVVKNKMHTVIFYDGLSDDFIEKYTNEYVSFVQIPEKDYGLTSMNDIRFMVYLDYILENPTLKKIIITDAADVVFNTNVFKSITRNKLYLCYDRDRTFEHYYVKQLIDNAYGSFKKFEPIKNKKIIQAGLFAGSMSKIVHLLFEMKKEFSITNSENNNNYVVFNYVAHTSIGDGVSFSKSGNDMKTKCGREIKYLTWEV